MRKYIAKYYDTDHDVLHGKWVVWCRDDECNGDYLVWYCEKRSDARNFARECNEWGVAHLACENTEEPPRPILHQP